MLLKGGGVFPYNCRSKNTTIKFVLFVRFFLFGVFSPSQEVYTHLEISSLGRRAAVFERK